MEEPRQGHSSGVSSWSAATQRSFALAGLFAAAIASLLGGVKLNGLDASRSTPCTIDRHINLTCTAFVKEYLGRKPVVFKQVPGRNGQFAYRTRRKPLEDAYGGVEIRMSTANSYTGHDWYSMTLRDYLVSILDDETGRMKKRGLDTPYLFGGSQGQELDELVNSLYFAPPFPSESVFEGESSIESLAQMSPDCRARAAAAMCAPYADTASLDAIIPTKVCGSVGIRERPTTLSFGIGGRGSGVPFHIHGPGFNEVVHGGKRWFLYAPGAKPAWNPDDSQAMWVERVLPTLDEDAAPLECSLEEGEVIYFPSNWLHATLNTHPYTVFVATFA